MIYLTLDWRGMKLICPPYLYLERIVSSRETGKGGKG